MRNSHMGRLTAMASKSQVDANRKNAKRSTGPRTKRGKNRSKNNAFRHGLAVPSSRVHELQDDIDELARILSTDCRVPEVSQNAREAAEAHIDLLRIREVRQTMVARQFADTIEGTLAAPDISQALKKIDRYERRAISRRTRLFSVFYL